MSSKTPSIDLAKLAHDHRMPLSVTDTAIFDYLSALDCPKSLAVWLLYDNKEHQQLVDLDINPLHYISVEEFKDSYCAWAFLSKSDFLKIDLSKKAYAMAKFFKFEGQCKETNVRFNNLLLDPSHSGPNLWLLNATAEKIKQILGSYSPDEFVDLANWGPGATTLMRGSDASAVNKFHLENGITRDLYSFVAPWFSTAYPRWSEQMTLEHGETCFNQQVGNKIVTVPKNSKTDRVIAVEPGINLWFQKALGKMIGKRLLRCGIDLKDQERNQELARVASVNGHLATVDFSSASDSIARNVVRELIPHDWYQLLNLCRTPLGIHDKRVIKWEKFSSMGNGFTFELESLIFYAAAIAVQEFTGVSGEVSVYGDDVIIPVECYDLFASFTAFLGFTVNLDKSFSQGSFRESCGAHWFGGVDCKPIFLKEKLRNVQSVYKLANSIRNLAHRYRSCSGCDRKFLRTWAHLFKRVPKPLRFGISFGYGDSGFVVNFDEATPALASHGFEGYRVRSLVELGITLETEHYALLLARLKDQAAPKRKGGIEFSDERNTLYTASDFALKSGRGKLSIRESRNTCTLRERTKIKIINILVPQWYNLGAWV